MSEFPRREFLKVGGALIVGFNLGGALFGQSHLDTVSEAAVPGPPDAKLIDTWLAIHSDNTATIFAGFAEPGQVNSTGLLQIAAEELDLDMSRLKTVARHQHYAEPGRDLFQRFDPTRRPAGSKRGRRARPRALLQLASKRLGAPVEKLTASKGVVSAAGSPGQAVTYGELTGDKPLHVLFTGSAPDHVLWVAHPLAALA